MWDLRNHCLAADLPSGGEGLDSGGVAFSPDGRWLATGDVASYSIWTVGTWARHRRFEHERPFAPAWLAYAPDGRTMVVAGLGYTTRLIDAATGQELATLTGPPTVRPDRLHLQP